MRYYQESTEAELTRKGVEKAVYPSTLPRNWNPEHVASKGFLPIVEPPKPEITNLQVITNGGTELGGGVRNRIWVVSNKFETTEQEAEYLAQEFDRAKVTVQTGINTLFNTEMAAVKGVVEQGEVDTFGTQETEALAYQADDTVPTPLLTGLAGTRGITVDVLAVRVLAHANAYKAAMGQVMGKKHKLEDQLKTATTLAHLEAIVVE